MRLNTTTMKNMCTTNSKSPADPAYTLDSSSLEVVCQHKYLGIVLNNKLTWDDHVQYVTSKANRLLGFILSVARDLS